MPKTYRLIYSGAVTYPADPISLRAIKDAQGLSNLTEEQKSKLKFKTVQPGEDCSDMPKESLVLFLEAGRIEEYVDAPKVVTNA